MQNYADSSFVISLLGEDANSAAAVRYMARHAPTLPFNPLHRLEVRNGIRLAVRRGEFEPAVRARIFERMEADLCEGFLEHVAVNWTDALRRAEALSARHTETLGTRAADILHVALALENGAQKFLSFDTVQRRLAEAEAMEVCP